MSVDVSVIIPAYRAGEFIQRAIDSALNQTGLNVEVIVVDDACPEQTGARVKREYVSEQRVAVVELAVNSGPAAARNVGFDHASGDWLAILDADDAFEHGRLARLVRAGAVKSADIIADNVVFLNAVKGTRSVPQLRIGESVRQVFMEDLLPLRRSSGVGMDLGLLKPMFRRDFLSSRSLRYRENIRHGEDFVFYFDLQLEGARFFVHPEVGYLWTLRNSGMSQTVVDYPSQAKVARELTAEPGAKRRPRVVEGLERRAQELDSLQQEYELVQLVKRRRVLAAIFFALRHPPSVLNAGRSYIKKKI